MDLLTIIHWWFILFIFGVIFLPLSSNIFSLFADKGYIFSKIIGMALITYTVLLLGFLHILPFYTPSIICLLLFFAFILYKPFFSIKNRAFLLKRSRFSHLLQFWKIFLFEEVIFFVGLYAWSMIRSYQPDIHGLEKYMDFGFLNSILRTTYFPPKDMWFPPFSINYYYFGHLATAILTKLSTLPSNITFNLMIATLFAFTFTASFSIGINLLSNFINKSQTRVFIQGLGGLL